MNRLSGIYFLFFFVIFFSCAKDSSVKMEEHKETRLFENVDPAVSGVNFRNDLMEKDSLNILDYLYFYNGGGVAIGDINNDGLQDIYFTSNQGPNELYLNKGNFVFENITEEAGVTGTAHWNTGVTMADVNADGFLDIYVVAVSGILGLQGKNELFINNGDGTFTEMAKEYGIDLENYGTTAAFFDYDNDGYLDLFVLNHAVHTEDSFGPAEVRNRRSEFSGDKLFRFDGQRFEDVSEKSGIFGGPNGYGLGLATADFNNDGFIDIYISNDFHEDDYLYINKGDGSFAEKLSEKIDQVSRFSMGSDVADINHDGYPDILTLDMLPEDEKVLKASMGDEDINVLNLRKKFGYHNQFSRNMLQVNKKGKGFQEIALQAGIAATDWSWSALFGDYDMDGEMDIFITNGIVKRPNDLDYIKYMSNREIRNTSSAGAIEKEALKRMPGGKVANYFFKGSGELVFLDVSGEWVKKEETFSNGSAYGDLDNDGDLDLVVNNLNETATIYKNDAPKDNKYLKLKFELEGNNRRGIGTKAYSWSNGILQYAQLFTGKGFQSSSEDVIHFGYGKASNIDSLVIVWPDGKVEKKFDVPTGQNLVLSPSDSLMEKPNQLVKEQKKMFEETAIRGFDYRHQENTYNDFDRQKLIPYRISDSGPAVAVGDLNNNGKEDIFIGNSRGTKAEIYLQTNNGFSAADLPFLEETKNVEITGVSIADFNGDGINDIFFVTGGGEFSGKSSALKDAFWTYNGKTWNKIELPEFYSNAGVLKVADMDNDKDLDVFIGGRAIAGDFGNLPESFLLENRGGKFHLVSNQGLRHTGMITDAAWEDINSDGFLDLILVGEWMAPKIYYNTKGVLEENTPSDIKSLTGLWRSIAAFDIDGDGKKEFLLGNWGLNSKLRASQEFPLIMYYGDIDNNSYTETIVARETNGVYYTLAGLDELVSQVSSLRKNFPSYSQFSGKNIEEIFGKNNLEEMEKFEVTTLESGYLKFEKEANKFVPFKKNLQFAPINLIYVTRDEKAAEEIAILGGNYFGVIPYHGAFAAFPGALIYSEENIIDGVEAGLDLSGKAVRDMKMISTGGNRFLLVFFNDEPVAIYKLNINEGFQ